MENNYLQLEEHLLFYKTVYDELENKRWIIISGILDKAFLANKTQYLKETIKATASFNEHKKLAFILFAYIT